MRTMPRHLAGVAILASLAATLGQPGLPSAAAGESCGEHGTSVSFAESPAEAARQALREEKLVFVLHVSGDFETPEFT